MYEKAPDPWPSSPAGLRPGRNFYSWHLNFADAPQIIALHAAYADLLRSRPGLTLVPLQHLNLDIQGIGFADRVPEQDLTAIVDATRHRLTKLGPISVTVGPATVTTDAIQLPVRPIAPLRHLRELTQAAIVDVWGDDAIPENPELDPHLPLAHSNDPTALADLSNHEPPSTALQVTSLTLLSVTHQDGRYQWLPGLSIAL